MTGTSAVHSGDADARIAAWEARTRGPIIVAAALPVIIQFLPRDGGLLEPAVDLTSWVVFAVDFAVHLWIRRDYWRTGRGLFDLAILVLTFPWYLLPATGDTAFMTVLRLVRLARLLLMGASGRLAAAVRRLGTLGIGLVVTALVASLIVLQFEPPESGFATLGDALWWAMVSFTTVGYGDLVPVTPEGRFAGLLMMLTGLTALGTVSAVLASVFTGQDDEREADRAEARDERLLHEMRSLQAEVRELRRRVGAASPPQVPKPSWALRPETAPVNPDADAPDPKP